MADPSTEAGLFPAGAPGGISEHKLNYVSFYIQYMIVNVLFSAGIFYCYFGAPVDGTMVT
jgi:hypothetical protein